MSTKLIIVRHAEAVGNVIRRFNGWTDEGITDRGKLQAQRVAKRLSDIPFTAIYASSLKRTVQTAEYIAQEKGLSVNITDGLKEIFGGAWEDMLWEDLPKAFPEAYDTWEYRPHLHQMPEGESMEVFLNRLKEAMMEILHKHPEETVCVVTHGTAIKALMCWFMGKPLDQMAKIPWYDNTAITIIEYEKDSFKMILEGDANHLDHETSTLHNQAWFLEYSKRLGELNNKEV